MSPVSEQWRRLAAAVLAKSGKTGLEGESVEQALSTVLEDGVTVRPLYTARDAPPDPGFPGAPPYVRGARAQGSGLGGWDIRIHHSDPDPDRVREAVVDDLGHGATSLWLDLGGNALPVDALPKVLDGLDFADASLVLDAGPEFFAAARQLIALYQDQGSPLDRAKGNLGADPLGTLARGGSEWADEPLLPQAIDLARLCVRDAPRVRALTVDALAYHDAGASPAQELGCALATAVSYLRALIDAGLPIDAAAAQLEFRYAATTDQFGTIAKLRAARRLWARVLEACDAGRAAGSGRIHAVTSAVMMAERDPWVNMLRTTVAALAAGVGGADALTVQPFDAALGLPDDFSRRIARNCQAILLDEAHLGRVVDPAGGSWYVESLTDAFARAGWAWFRELEGAGGMGAALGSGLVADRIGATWSRRAGRLATRREQVLGVSEFPNLHEERLVRPPAPARPRGSGGLPRVRTAQEFEALRARSDAVLAATGSRPRIALVAIGPERLHGARVSFATSLFQAGGIETKLVHVGDLGSAPAEATAALAAAALPAAGSAARNAAPIACLCSSDALYAEHAAGVAGALAEAGLRRIWLAGRPGDRADAYKASGVTGYVYAGCDALAVLREALDSHERNGAGQ